MGKKLNNCKFCSIFQEKLFRSFLHLALFALAIRTK